MSFSRGEVRGVMALSGVMFLRMFGLFALLPVVAPYTHGLSGGENLAVVGLAVSVYGLTQACLQIPFGWLSDRVGRRAVIAGGLLVFAAGGVVAAVADSALWIVVGRSLQGGGAIAGVVMALAVDVTAEDNRAKAMGILGMSIGLAFALAIVFGSALAAALGVPTLFAVVSALALAALAPLALVRAAAPRSSGSLRAAVKLPGLWRLSFCAFALHYALSLTFLVIPLELEPLLGEEQRWLFYLGTFTASLLIAVPAIVIGERRNTIQRLPIAGSLALIAFFLLVVFASRTDELTLFLLSGTMCLFFQGFNVLEAVLPALMGRVVPSNSRGSAFGVYSTCQFAGTFLGGAVGGVLAATKGIDYALISGVAVTAAAGFIGRRLLAYDKDFQTADLRVSGENQASGKQESSKSI